MNYADILSIDKISKIYQKNMPEFRRLWRFYRGVERKKNRTFDFSRHTLSHIKSHIVL